MLKYVGFFALLFFLLVSCISNSDEDSIEQIEKTPISSPLKTGVYADNFSAYFKALNPDILALIQNGSPSAIKEAVTVLRKSSTEYSEQEKVILAICTSIMKYAWFSEKVTWEVPPTSSNNIYVSTLSSIGRGIYETSFDNTDFFSLTLPALLLFSAPSVTNYYDEAKKSLKLATDLAPESVLAHYLSGVLSFRMKNYEDAVIHLQKAWNFDYDNLHIAYSYIQALAKADRIVEAFDLGADLLTKNPTNIELLKLCAELAFEMEDYSVAEEFVAQILQREPDNEFFLLFRAYILFELKDYLTVSTLLDVYSRIDKTSKDYLLLRAQLQKTWNKNTTAAIKTIEEALALYPDDADCLILAAELSLMGAKNILSKTPSDLLKPVLARDPNNIKALEILIKEAVVKGEWQEAYTLSTTIAQNNNYTQDAAILHAEISIKLNLLDEARKTLELFYTVDTDDENLQQWYIRLLIAEGKNSQALSLISQLLPTATGAMRSILYFERSRLVSSDVQILSDLRSSLTAYPRNEFALYGLYEYYYGRKDYRKAQYYLRQVIALNPSDDENLQRNTELNDLLR